MHKGNAPELLNQLTNRRRRMSRNSPPTLLLSALLGLHLLSLSNYQCIAASSDLVVRRRVQEELPGARALSPADSSQLLRSHSSSDGDCLFGLQDESTGLPFTTDGTAANTKAKANSTRACQDLQQMHPTVKANCSISDGIWRPKQCNPLFYKLWQDFQLRDKGQFMGCVVKMSFETAFENWQGAIKSHCEFLRNASTQVATTCSEQDVEQPRSGCLVPLLRYFDLQETFALDSLCQLSADDDLVKKFQHLYAHWLERSSSSPLVNVSYWNSTDSSPSSSGNAVTTVINLVPPMKVSAASTSSSMRSGSLVETLSSALSVLTVLMVVVVA